MYMPEAKLLLIARRIIKIARKKKYSITLLLSLTNKYKNNGEDSV